MQVFLYLWAIPKGSDVNKGILDFDKQPILFSPAGELAVNKDGTKPDFGYTNNYDKEFALCKELIAAYSKTVDEFDYEQFMDVLRSKTLCGDWGQVPVPSLKVNDLHVYSLILHYCAGLSA